MNKMLVREERNSFDWSSTFRGDSLNKDSLNITEVLICSGVLQYVMNYYDNAQTRKSVPYMHDLK